MPKNSRKEKHIGETKMMKCGMNAIIIAYRSACDIDVQFEDDTIVTNKTYKNFRLGNVRNPKISTRLSNKNESLHIGETKLMRCGLNATVIAYRGTMDIDIQFEDGIIVTNKSYGNFVKQRIGHPNICGNNVNKGKERIGETRMMNCGMKATIIAYRRSDDIDVQFEDGVVVTNKQYDNFKNGIMHNPIATHSNIYKHSYRVDETRIMNCGVKATIIAYRGCCEIDVQFENGTIVTNRRYDYFKHGLIKCPKKK